MTVYYIHPDGSPDGSWTSPADPCPSPELLQTILTAETYDPGDQFLFAWGYTFPGPITVTKGGTKKDPIIFGSYIPDGVNPADSHPPFLTGEAVFQAEWEYDSGDVWKTVFYPQAPSKVYAFMFRDLAGTPQIDKASVTHKFDWFFDSSAGVLYVYSPHDMIPPAFYGISPYEFRVISSHHVLFLNSAGNVVVRQLGFKRWFSEETGGSWLPGGAVHLSNASDVEIYNNLFVHDGVYHDKFSSPAAVRHDNSSSVFHHNTVVRCPVGVYGYGAGNPCDFWGNLFAGCVFTQAGGISGVAKDNKQLGVLFPLAYGTLKDGGGNEEIDAHGLGPIAKVKGGDCATFVVDDPFLNDTDYTVWGAIPVDLSEIFERMGRTYQDRGLKGPALAVVPARLSEDPLCPTDAVRMLKEAAERGFEICNHSWSHRNATSLAGFFIQCTAGFHTSAAYSVDQTTKTFKTILDGTDDIVLDLGMYDTLDKIVWAIENGTSWKGTYTVTFGVQGVSSNAYTKSAALYDNHGSPTSITTQAMVVLDPIRLPKYEIEPAHEYLVDFLGFKVSPLYIQPFTDPYIPTTSLITKGYKAVRSAFHDYSYSKLSQNYFSGTLSRFWLPGIPTILGAGQTEKEIRQTARRQFLFCQITGQPAIFYTHPAQGMADDFEIFVDEILRHGKIVTTEELVEHALDGESLTGGMTGWEIGKLTGRDTWMIPTASPEIRSAARAPYPAEDLYHRLYPQGAPAVEAGAMRMTTETERFQEGAS